MPEDVILVSRSDWCESEKDIIEWVCFPEVVGAGCLSISIRMADSVGTAVSFAMVTSKPLAIISLAAAMLVLEKACVILGVASIVNNFPSPLSSGVVAGARAGRDMWDPRAAIENKI